ncbi:MAG: hypothetical protein WA125_12035 [Desulfosporosinus sp.]
MPRVKGREGTNTDGKGKRAKKQMMEIISSAYPVFAVPNYRQIK